MINKKKFTSNSLWEKIKTWRYWYMVAKVVFFWICIPVTIYDWYVDWSYSHLKFNEKKAERYLDKDLPKLVKRVYFRGGLEVDGFKLNDYYNSTNNTDYGVSIVDLGSTKGIPMRRKRFYIKFTDKLWNYLTEKYEIEGYEKIPKGRIIKFIARGD